MRTVKAKSVETLQLEVDLLLGSSLSPESSPLPSRAQQSIKAESYS